MLYFKLSVRSWFMVNFNDKGNFVTFRLVRHVERSGNFFSIRKSFPGSHLLIGHYTL